MSYTIYGYLEEIINFSLYEDTKITDDLKDKLNKIIDLLNTSPNIVGEVLKLEQYRTNNNALYFDRYLNVILGKLSLKLSDKYALLREDIPVEQTTYLWQKMNINSKVNYLENKKYLSNLDIKRLAISLNSKKFNTPILENQVIMKKIPDGALMIDTSNLTKNILKYEMLIPKLNGNTIANWLNKYFSEFNDFKEIIKNNSIIKVVPKYSLNLTDVSKEEFNEFVSQHPILLTKIKAAITTKLVNLDTLNNLLVKNLSKEILSTIKELKMVMVSKSGDKSVITKYFTDNFIIQSPVNSIYIYPFDSLSTEMITKFKTNYTYLQKLHFNTMVTFINKELTEEEKINLLRNTTFIKDIDGIYLTKILNEMSFRSVFNMLQNVNILNKIKNLNVKIKAIDKIFIAGFLDSPSLINIISVEFLKNMLDFLENDDLIKYLNYPYIYIRFKNKDLLNILIKHKINLFVSTPKLLKYFSKSEIIYYLNNLITDGNMRYDLLFSDYCLTQIIGLEKKLGASEIEDIKYLIEKIYLRDITTLSYPTLDVETFKSFIGAYLIFGLDGVNKMYELGNKTILLSEINKLEMIYLNFFGSNVINNETYIVLKKRFRINRDKHFKLKDYLYFEYQKRLEKNFLTKYKFNILAQLLKIDENSEVTNNKEYTFYSSFFVNYDVLISDDNELKIATFDKKKVLGNMENYFNSKCDFQLDFALNNVIYPYANKESIADIMNNLGFSKPAYFDICFNENKEIAKIKKINKKLEILLDAFNDNDKIIILNSIVYNTALAVDVSSYVMQELINIKRTIKEFYGKINVSKSDKCLTYVSILNITEDDDLRIYNDNYRRLLRVINYFEDLANKYISDEIIKERFSDEYLNAIKSICIPSDVSDDDIVLIEHKMYLDDFKLLFGNVDINQEYNLDDLIKNKLYEIIPYIIDGYFKDYTVNFSNLFNPSNTLDDFSSWENIIRLVTN